MTKRLMKVPIPPCPDSKLGEPVRKFEDTHSMEKSFLEYHFGFKIEEGVNLTNMTREERREALFGKKSENSNLIRSREESKRPINNEIIG